MANTGAAWTLSDTVLCDELVRVWATEQAAAARRLELVRQLDVRDLARAQGATSLTAWLVGKLRITSGHARRMIEVAATLDRFCEDTTRALAAGTVNEQQTTVITDTIKDLADEGEGVRRAAEDLLLTPEFTGLEPATLRKAAAHILARIAPAIADERDRKALEQAEKRAARDRALTWSPYNDGTGRERLTAVYGAEDAAIIKAACNPLTTPAGQDDDRTATQRRADALAHVCRYTLASGDLPEDGGDAAKIVITMNFDDLAATTGAGMLDNGTTITPEAVRRLACNAGIIPAVMASPSMPINLGRLQRLFTGAARRALVLRDRGCVFPGCDRPPQWCEAHHAIHWANGGPTDLNNGALLRLSHECVSCSRSLGG